MAPSLATNDEVREPMPGDELVRGVNEVALLLARTLRGPLTCCGCYPS
jgi:hypothetical protein